MGINHLLSARSLHKSPERNIMERLLADLQQHALSWAFLQPVNADDVPDYYEVIKEPMGAHLP
jgi:histone acetyltransferase